MTNVRTICEGRFDLPMPVAAAVLLFTPEGERRWAGPDWDPVYAVESADRSAPGTVFTTESHGGPAVWIVLERRPDGLRYARVVPGRIAGTISVACAPGTSADECVVEVAYDVTALGPDGAAFARELEAGYDAFLEGWRAAILESHEGGA